MVVNALVVPDEQTWTVSGLDPATLHATPVFEPGAVRRLLLPERLPEALVGPVAAWLSMVPIDVERDERRLPFPGSFDVDRLPETDGHAGELALPGHHEHGEHGEHAGHDEHSEHEAHSAHSHDHGHEGHDEHAGHHEHGPHGGHDHGDMMAIVGEPSADGLVMEPIDFRFGSLGTPFPAGLAADVKLDGDVVDECRIEPLLVADGSPPGSPDRLAPQAWELALMTATEVTGGVSAPPRDRWTRIADVELERAISHTAWLRAFARLLGWPSLVERTTWILRTLDEARALQLPALVAAERELDEFAVFVRRSRWLRWRTGGRGRISTSRARELGLRGPAARASGVPDDARTADPLYERLEFDPVVRSEGDAWARTLVRTTEAAAALRLAADATRAAAEADLAAALPPASGTIEGPRGPLRAAHDGSRWRLHAPGEASAREAAGAAAVGAEWAGALVILASFDLSPWRVGP